MTTWSRDGAPQAADREFADLETEVRALRKEVAMLRLVNAELERVVVRDTLTPLYNRRHFISSLNERISRVGRYGARAVLILIDVNGMKRINDAHGHPAGDFALMWLAELLADAIRSTDVAARIGGDEFALILDEMDLEQAEAKAAQLRTLIGAMSCKFGDVELAVGASFGCAEIRGGDADADTIARADAKMYAEKRKRH